MAHQQYTVSLDNELSRCFALLWNISHRCCPANFETLSFGAVTCKGRPRSGCWRGTVDKPQHYSGWLERLDLYVATWRCSCPTHFSLVRRSYCRPTSKTRQGVRHLRPARDSTLRQ